MDGYTDCAFRQIVKEIFDKYGEKDNYELYLWTEFMNADGYIINPVGVMKHLMMTKEQAPVIAQIFGGNEDMLIKCFKDIQEKYFLKGVQSKKRYINPKPGTINSELPGGVAVQEKQANTGFPGFAGLELNIGCPARNVMSTGGGSALLKNKTECLRIIKNIREGLRIPFSIKTRTGLNDDDKKEQMEFLIKASKYVDMITIHGRTVKQVYAGLTDWDFIYHLKESVSQQEQCAYNEIKNGELRIENGKKNHTSCKILGNGGISSYQEIETIKGNLDGVLIGQAAIGNPRIFTPHIPDKKEIKETILKHLDYMIATEIYFQGGKMERWKNGKILIMPTKENLDEIILHLPQLKSNVQGLSSIVVAFRKHLFQYIKGIPGSKELKVRLSQIKEYEPLVKEIQNFFG
ncbi:MAG: tRNA-dihydrouridine synthase family protein [Candidatus Absconditabacterales bacterium]